MSEDTLRDRFAVVAPAAPSYFVPTMSWDRPTAAQSPTEVFSSGSASETNRITFDNFYNTETKTWNDEGYQEQNGVPISLTLKNAVAEQQAFYDEYLAKDAEWVAENELERLYQWPYYWADKVIQRRQF